ncbi:MAG: hypothetical protein U0Y08_13015 [Bacteroidia bacterium]
MKNGLIWLFVLSFIAGGDNLYQLSRLPVLVQHFLHHQTTHLNSFSEFYQEHYGGNDADEHDTTDDQTLPFKGHPAFLVLQAFLIHQEFSMNTLSFIPVKYHDLFVVLPDITGPEHWQPPC